MPFLNYFDHDLGGGNNRMKLSTKEYIVYSAIGLGFIGLIILYVFEFPFFHNMFGLKTFLIVSLGFGLLLGFGIAWRNRAKAKDPTEKFQLFVAALFLTTLFMPLIFSLINRGLSFHPPKMERVEYFEERAFSSSRFGYFEGEEIAKDGYYLYFIRDGKLERARTKVPFPGKPEKGEMITLPVRKGLLGFSYVEVKAI